MARVFYNALLKRSPLATQMATAGVISFGGDLIAQNAADSKSWNLQEESRNKGEGSSP